MDYIQYFYPRSFKDFFDNNQKDFIINQSDIASLRKQRNTNELELIKEADYPSKLKAKLEEFAKASKEFNLFLQSGWPLSRGYSNFIKDKEQAQDILQKSSRSSIDELKALLGDRMISHETIIQKLRK